MKVTGARQWAGRGAARFLAGVVLSGGLLLAELPFGAMPANAHHDWGAYSPALLELTGRVRAYAHVAPHARLELEVGDQVFQILLASPAELEQRGFRAELIRAGDTVTVQGYAHRQNRSEFRAERIRIGGKTFQMR